MAAGSRTLKLTILGDVDNLNKSLKSASTDVDTFGDKIGRAGIAIGAAFAAAAAAAGAYAIKIGIDGVKAAIEDEKAQIQLANALSKATGATNDQIAATEEFVLQTSLAYGVTDSDLRPALQRLALATKDLNKAQDLLTLAVDISAGSGKSLETVTNALAKANEGNTTALGRLGVGLTAAELKSMSFEDAQKRLSDLWAGAASANANTFEGRINRMKIAFDEAKESIGFALLPVLERMMRFIQNQAIPAVNALVAGFTGKSGLSKGASDAEQAAFAFGETIKEAAKSAQGFFNVFNNSANTGSSSGFAKLISFLDTILTEISKVVRGVSYLLAALGVLANPSNWLKSGDEIDRLIRSRIGEIQVPSTGFSGTTPGGVSFSTGSISTITGGTGTVGGGGGGATVGGGIASAVASAAAATSSVVTGSFNAGSFRAAEARTSGDTYNINVTGAIDVEGTARTIVDVLNQSSYRGTLGAGGLVGMVAI